MPRLRRLTTTIAATILAGVAVGQSPAEPEHEFSVLSGVTVTCTAAAPSWSVGCFAERRVLTVGPLEVAVGVDARTVLTGTLDDASLAPYGIVAVYLETSSYWLEVRLPQLAGVPVIGSSDWLRVGFSLQIP